MITNSIAMRIQIYVCLLTHSCRQSTNKFHHTYNVERIYNVLQMHTFTCIVHGTAIYIRHNLTYITYNRKILCEICTILLILSVSSSPLCRTVKTTTTTAKIVTNQKIFTGQNTLYFHFISLWFALSIIIIISNETNAIVNATRTGGTRRTSDTLHLHFRL